MKKLKLALDDLRVDTFTPVDEQASLRGTVRAASACRYSDINCTDYFSTCEAGGGTTLATGIPINTYEESFCHCSDVYSCECKFSEASNCHRCTGP